MVAWEKLWDEKNRLPVLAASGALVSIIAVIDWLTSADLRLGLLYLFPILLAAPFLPRTVTFVGGIGCALLSEYFGETTVSLVRLPFEAVALAGSGLFMAELVRNHRLNVVTQQRLNALVETSPAAIVTVDQRGLIERANQAAIALMKPPEGELIGSPIAASLPELHQALRWEQAPQFRAFMQCRGHRPTGEVFEAEVWFSTYREGTSPKLAAIIADISELDTARADSDKANGAAPSAERPELSKREAEVVGFIVQGLTNKEIGQKMDLSESTIKGVLQQLFAKTGVRTRGQLVRVALEQYRDLL